jgi:NRAMP (natural resistance-associated macrophage protein)-like metal ion transporter
MSNAMAILLQTLSARLGVVSGRDLAQTCREAYPRPISHILWVFCEVAIAACDLAEVLGAAIGLNLLFQIPLLMGVLFTAADTLFLLWFQQYRIRTLESTVLRLILIVSFCLGVEILLAKPVASEVVRGLIPRLDKSSLFITIAILGATVMPHNLYLHSALVQTRRIGKSAEAKRKACWYNLADTMVALNAAMFVNIAILVLAGAVFFKNHRPVTEIQSATRLLEPLLGTKAASVIFAAALLCAGQASTLTGTMAGQIVMEGFLNFRMRAWLRRFVTRLLAIIPAAITVYFSGDQGAYQLLLVSQVVLSMQLPFAMIPLIHFTGDRRRMGEFANKTWLQSLAWLAAAAIVVLNLNLAGSRIRDWLASEGPHSTLIRAFGVPLVGGLVVLLLYIFLYPFFRRFVPDPLVPEAAVADGESGIPDDPIFLERLGSEGAQHLSEARFDAFMNHLHGLAFIKDPTGRYVYFNSASSTLLGLSQDQIIFRRDEDIWPRELAKKLQMSDQTIFRDRKTTEGIELIPQNGVIHSWVIYRFPIVERETGAVFLGAVGFDITDRKQIEEQLLKTRKNEMMGRLAGGMAHHFNNLLTVIIGYSQIVAADLPPLDEGRVNLEQVLDAADRASVLTNQLLAFSRRQMLLFRELNLNELLTSMHAVLKSIAGDRIVLEIEPGADPAAVKADVRHVEQIIVSLALNARDAMRESGGTMTVTTSNFESDGNLYVRLSVRDTGTGMDEYTKSRLFEAFFTTKAMDEGNGLALCSAYGTARQHGGWITVDTELGKGSTFHLDLPTATQFERQTVSKFL